MQIKGVLDRIGSVCTAGFAIAFHVRYTTPDFLFQTYDREWIKYYDNNGFVVQDPVVAWGFSETGTIRWSDLEDQDAAGVMSAARDHGLNYGAACSVTDSGSRSFAGFARADRDFTDEEIAELADLVLWLHRETSDEGGLSPEAREELRRISVKQTH